MSKQPDALEKARKKLSPKAYSESMKTIDLESIFLKDVKVSHFSHELGGENRIDFSENCEIVERDGTRVVIEVSYLMTARSGRKKLLTLRAKYWVVFRTGAELPEEFFTIYNSSSLPLQTFPYFRELTNSMFSRTGLPPLILPLRKFLIGNKR